MPFRNREHAARLLAEALQGYRGKNPLILAIPRGAVPMGKILADTLGGELDVMLVHKLGAPGQPELAIGSVDEKGEVYLHPYAAQLGIRKEYVEKEKKEQLKVIQERRRYYTQAQTPISPQDRIVMVLDDGIATGSTMMAALGSLRKQGPKILIAVTAVAPPDTIQRLKGAADEVVCLETPEYFQAVGQFFEDFRQVSDEEVIAALAAMKGIDPEVKIPAEGVTLEGELNLPAQAHGVVLFAHGSGSSRHSPRNQYVAKVLQSAKIGTLLFDLLSPKEDEIYETRFNIELLTQRLITATRWLRKRPETKELSFGYFGASTGAAAALWAAAELGKEIKCVVSRGGRPDLALEVLPEVTAPTLLIVGGWDDVVIGLNQKAFVNLQAEKKLEIVPEATHLFEEPGKLEEAARLAKDWFLKYL